MARSRKYGVTSASRHQGGGETVTISWDAYMRRPDFVAGFLDAYNQNAFMDIEDRSAAILYENGRFAGVYFRILLEKKGVEKVRPLHGSAIRSEIKKALEYSSHEWYMKP